MVKPEYNLQIEKKIERLTKITTDMVQTAPTFNQAFAMFTKWCLSIQDEVQILQWSESDMTQVKKEMQLKNYSATWQESAILNEWIDFQRELDNKLGVERQVSLSRALQYAGMDFEGQIHDALYDARNTGKLLKVVRTPELCKKALSNVIFILEEKSIGTSLGEIFKSNGIQFATA